MSDSHTVTQFMKNTLSNKVPIAYTCMFIQKTKLQPEGQDRNHGTDIYIVCTNAYTYMYIVNIHVHVHVRELWN